MSKIVTHPAEAGADARIEALECKLMHAEDQLESLNLALYRQQQVIERLQAQIKDIKALVSAGAANEGSAKDEIPPHY